MKKAFPLLVVLGFSTLLFGQAADVKYHGLLADDPVARNGLANPERGFRWENRFGSFEPKWADDKWIKAILAHAHDGVTMTQGYCEMIAYAGEPRISEAQIKRLEESFQALRENGLKVLLCFRYEMNTEQEGPTVDIILGHIRQLKPVLRRNMDVIAVLQAGFIGLYGEWHRSYHKLDQDPGAQEKILTALLDVLPPGRKLVLRYPRHKNSFVQRVSGRAVNDPITAAEAHTMRPEARIGFCDHGFMVGNNDAGTFAPRPSKDYDYMTRESLFAPMDGELFWVWSPLGALKYDGLEAIRRLWEHHYTLFSYTHNHSVYESWQWKEKMRAHYSLDEWKEELVDPEFLRENAIPFAEEYFRDSAGRPVARSIFEYIRDHLGYRLALTGGVYMNEAVPGQEYHARFSLVNHGFAAPVNPRPVHLVLIGQDQLQLLASAGAEVRKWYPCDPEKRETLAPEHKLEFFVKSFPSVEPGRYRLGIWMPDGYESLQDDARYSIRLANRDVAWWCAGGGKYGVNIVGELTVKGK